MPDTILLQNITFSYAGTDAPALCSVTLAVPEGQICGVVGRAGAGKSTLCALCAGFIPNFYRGTLRGQAQVDGQDVARRPIAELVRHVGLVSSNPFSQISGARFTVYEEIGFGLENLGLPREEIIERITWVMNVLQLAHLRDASPYALSGGQQQRLVLAATLAMRPPVLVLDEPTAQLDPPATADLAGILRDLQRQGITVLFAEHRLEWVAELADRVVVLADGQIIADGSPTRIFTDEMLLERGVGWPRPALIADWARRQGYWPGAVALAVTRDHLIAGLREATSDGQTDARLRVPERAMASGLASRNDTNDKRGEAAPIVEVEAVHFSYPTGVAALRGVSLAIHPGERIALLGRNGAGKSTLVRHLNGLLRPSAGCVHVAGTATTRTTVANCARSVSIVFQDIRNQFFARTVRDELRFGPRNLGYRPAEVEVLVERALEALDLTDVATEHPYDLPLARRRLVAIAAALAMNSPLLVLDEPTAGLDSAGVDMLAVLVREIATQGRGVLVVSHDLDFCFDALDRVVLLREGQVTLDSAWSEIDATARDTLAGEVGLPLGLEVAQVLQAKRVNYEGENTCDNC